MNKRDLHQTVVGMTCRATGVGEPMMMHSNREECVDARSILINVLISKGFTENEVSDLTGLSQQGVNKLKNNFHIRLRKWTVTTNFQQVNNELSTHLQHIFGRTTDL